LRRSIADVLKIDIALPDHTTLSRRGGGLTILPKRIHCTEPLHLLVDIPRFHEEAAGVKIAKAPARD
jgi:hypothetical protein